MSGVGEKGGRVYCIVVQTYSFQQPQLPSSQQPLWSSGKGIRAAHAAAHRRAHQELDGGFLAKPFVAGFSAPAPLRAGELLFFRPGFLQVWVWGLVSCF